MEATGTEKNNDYLENGLKYSHGIMQKVLNKQVRPYPSSGVPFAAAAQLTWQELDFQPLSAYSTNPKINLKENTFLTINKSQLKKCNKHQVFYESKKYLDSKTNFPQMAVTMSTGLTNQYRKIKNYKQQRVKKYVH